MDFERRRARRILAEWQSQQSQQSTGQPAEQQNSSEPPEGWDIPGVAHEKPVASGSGATVDDPELRAAVDSINASSNTLREEPGDRLTDDETVRLLAGIADARRRLDAAYLTIVALVDKRSTAKCAGLGVKTTQGLVKSLAGATPGRAKADVEAARAVHGRAASAGTALVPAKPASDGPLADMGELLAAGDVSMAHLDTAVRALSQVPDRILDKEIVPATDGAESSAGEEAGGPAPRPVRDEICRFFAKAAPSTSPGNLRLLGQHLIQVLEPDADDHFDPDSFGRRSMTMGTDITGMVFGTYQLDPAAGAALRAILDPLSAPRPAQRDQDGNVVVRDTRTPDQRRADALGELVSAASPLAAAAAPDGTTPDGTTPDGTTPDGTTPGITSAAAAPDMEQRTTPARQAEGLFGLQTENQDGEGAEAGRGPSRAAKFRPGRRPARVTVVTTAEKVFGSDQGPSHCFQTGDIGPGTLARISCNATFERLILDARGAILDLGTPVRLATPAQRRAISARDRGCAFPGCDRPPSWCDVHHVIWYSRGGPTDVGNMCLLCEQHHTLIHTGTWRMQMINGIPYTKPETGTMTLASSGPFRIDDTYTSTDGWVRNSYFDQLKEVENLADIVTRTNERPPG